MPPMKIAKKNLFYRDSEKILAQKLQGHSYTVRFKEWAGVILPFVYFLWEFPNLFRMAILLSFLQLQNIKN